MLQTTVGGDKVFRIIREYKYINVSLSSGRGVLRKKYQLSPLILNMMTQILHSQLDFFVLIYCKS